MIVHRAQSRPERWCGPKSLFAGAAGAMLLMGGCFDDRDPCVRAEEALQRAAEECGEDIEDYNLYCDSLGPSADCSQLYESIAATARCENGSVEFETVPCY